ncbi:MAG: hypothetical protein RR565_07320 [Erysipelothrix sp.]
MKQKLTEFMRGRYGVDMLNKFLMNLTIAMAIIATVVSLMTGNQYLFILWLIPLVLSYYRMLSRNINRRYQENQKYLLIYNKVRNKLRAIKNRIVDFPKYKYLKCPNCGATMRVPRRKGKITVTCPKCSHRFDAKS